LEAAGLTEPGSYYEYARGKVVVWVPKDSKLDLSSGLKALLNPSIKKIAVANPQHAPYGQAAVAAMQKKGIYDEVKQKLVLGENISQTASFVMSGSADVGIVALSLALSTNMKDKGQYVEIPADDYPPLEQASVVLSASKNKETAKQFLAFIETYAVANTLKRYGFDVRSSQGCRTSGTGGYSLGEQPDPALDGCRSRLWWRLFGVARTEWDAETLLEQRSDGEKMARRFEEANALWKQKGDVSDLP
jgi:molybdenum ABC transporter molybdate-binding protein